MDDGTEGNIIQKVNHNHDIIKHIMITIKDKEKSRTLKV